MKKLVLGMLLMSLSSFAALTDGVKSQLHGDVCGVNFPVDSEEYQQAINVVLAAKSEVFGLEFNALLVRDFAKAREYKAFGKILSRQVDTMLGVSMGNLYGLDLSSAQDKVMSEFCAQLRN